jgi:hypothetical protein|eukprot:SAG25_NODE_69_length_17425_cov_289.898476_6_plen_48_part_00
MNDTLNIDTQLPSHAVAPWPLGSALVLHVGSYMYELLHRRLSGHDEL